MFWTLHYYLATAKLIILGVGNIYTHMSKSYEYLRTHVCVVEVLQVRMTWCMDTSTPPMLAKGRSSSSLRKTLSVVFVG